MSKLTIINGSSRTELSFSGNPTVAEVLRAGGISVEHPCGGRGVCGKCAIDITGSISEPDAAETKAGKRLSCRAVLLGDAEVTLGRAAGIEQIELSGLPEDGQGNGRWDFSPLTGKLGAAIDIGTTTIAAKLFRLSDGVCLGEYGVINPQTAIAADVIGRIDASLHGKTEELKGLVLSALEKAISELCLGTGAATEDVGPLVITGNTTMLYLLTGRNPDSLSHAPFDADWLFGETVEILGRPALLPPCLNSFVGADTATAVLACGMCGTAGGSDENEADKSDGNGNAGRVSVMCDIGTNGEIALWKDGRLYVTSTAAGPAFEGAGISCGCGSRTGAVDKVWLEDGEVRYHVIGEGGNSYGNEAGECAANGICGSGLLDAIATFLETEQIDETGASDEGDLRICEGVTLTRKDVRSVQLAKAAIAAGLKTVLEVTGTDISEVGRLYIAGGFGNHMNVDSAVRIGLIPEELKDKTVFAGNAALAGAVALLLSGKAREEIDSISALSQHVNLGGTKLFNELYVDEMFFPECD